MNAIDAEEKQTIDRERERRGRGQGKKKDKIKFGIQAGHAACPGFNAITGIRRSSFFEVYRRLQGKHNSPSAVHSKTTCPVHKSRVSLSWSFQ